MWEINCRTRTKFFEPRTHRLLWDAASPEAKYTNQNCKPLQLYQRKDKASHINFFYKKTANISSL